MNAPQTFENIRSAINIFLVFKEIMMEKNFNFEI